MTLNSKIESRSDYFLGCKEAKKIIPVNNFNATSLVSRKKDLGDSVLLFAPLYLKARKSTRSIFQIIDLLLLMGSPIV